ncbi:MAG: hypothetical protein ACREQ9_25125 [Candidatus Binatia bacterium]
MADGFLSLRLPLLLALAAAALACERSPEARTAPRLPEGSAGKILARAIEASGGWERWQSLRDVAFVSSFTLYDPLGNVTSETIGVHRSPLHTAPRARFESLGLPERVTIGFDGERTWMLRDGRPVPGRDQLLLARFNMVSDIFWFSMPFNLAEIPVEIRDLGDEETHEGRWHRLRVTLGEGAPEAPGDWFVVYFDARSGLVSRVFTHVTASFLPHKLWVGKWLDYQDWDGLRKERRRQFFPADAGGVIIGNLAAERLMEDVRLNTGVAEDMFEKPAAERGGQAA